MRTIIAFTLFGLLMSTVSCTVNRSLSDTRSNYRHYQQSDEFVLRLDRVAAIANDSTMLEDLSKGISYLKNFSSRKYKSDTRTVVYRNIENLLNAVQFVNQKDRKLVFKLWVDRKGGVIAAEYDNNTTAIISKNAKIKVLGETLGYKFTPDENAPELVNTKLVITFNEINAMNSRY